MTRSGKITAMQVLRGCKPSGVPLVVWKKLLVFRYASAVYLLAWAGSGVFLLFVPQRDALTVVLYGVWGISMLFFDFVVFWIGRVVKRRVLACEFVVCTHCGYRLAGLPSTHCCPECGNAYTLAQVEREWREWLYD